MKSENYKKNWRQLELYRVVSNFQKPENYGMPLIPQTQYVLGLDWTDAFQNARNVYTVGDRKYFEMLTIEKLGNVEGIGYLT